MTNLLWNEIYKIVKFSIIWDIKQICWLHPLEEWLPLSCSGNSKVRCESSTWIALFSNFHKVFDEELSCHFLNCFNDITGKWKKQCNNKITYRKRLILTIKMGASQVSASTTVHVCNVFTMNKIKKCYFIQVYIGIQRSIFSNLPLGGLEKKHIFDINFYK